MTPISPRLAAGIAIALTLVALAAPPAAATAVGCAAHDAFTQAVCAARERGEETTGLLADPFADPLAYARCSARGLETSPPIETPNC